MAQIFRVIIPVSNVGAAGADPFGNPLCFVRGGTAFSGGPP